MKAIVVLIALVFVMIIGLLFNNGILVLNLKEQNNFRKKPSVTEVKKSSIPHPKKASRHKPQRRKGYRKYPFLNKTEVIFFERKFKEFLKEQKFVTIYNIYHDMGSAAKIKNIITITHDKLKKKLIVNVKETKGTILDYDETFSKSYSELSREMAIKNNTYGLFVDEDLLPYDLAIKFVSDKFENAKIVEVLGYNGGDKLEFAEYFTLLD